MHDGLEEVIEGIGQNVERSGQPKQFLWYFELFLNKLLLLKSIKFVETCEDISTDY